MINRKNTALPLRLSQFLFHLPGLPGAAEPAGEGAHLVAQSVGAAHVTTHQHQHARRLRRSQLAEPGLLGHAP